MTPYASVYSDISMSHEVAQLTRHEFVMVEWYNDGIAKVRYNIQSGKGTSHQVDDLNGEYVGTGDLTGTGYMYTNAFAIPIVATQEDGQREVCELAYSRLGTKGVYSQTKRYLDVYLDCSALCAWAYYQIGYQIYAGSWSNCVGIGNYLKDHPDAIVWEAGYQQPSCIPEGATNISFSSDQYNAAGGAPAVEPAEIFPGSKSEMEAILEPGDVIMFNHYAPTTCTYTITENGIPQEVSKTEHLMVVQDASTLEEAYEKFGFDHAALYIGDGKIIESSSPSQNTLVSELAGRTNEIVAVYRPLADDTLKY